jgi:hypothetical protein
MWGRKRQADGETVSAGVQPGPLKQAVRQARIDSAERTGVVVDLRDAELARLELLNDALDPLFAEIPPEIELFDRGISQGDTPRLWIDAVAHVDMGRDKRRYRLLQDTRYGRKLLAESIEITAMGEAITHYVASRMVERERALSGDDGSILSKSMRHAARAARRRDRWRTIRAFLFGLVVGGVVLFAALWMIAAQFEP